MCFFLFTQKTSCTDSDLNWNPTLFLITTSLSIALLYGFYFKLYLSLFLYFFVLKKILSFVDTKNVLFWHSVKSSNRTLVNSSCWHLFSRFTYTSKHDKLLVFDLQESMSLLLSRENAWKLLYMKVQCFYDIWSLDDKSRWPNVFCTVHSFILILLFKQSTLASITKLLLAVYHVPRNFLYAQVLENPLCRTDGALSYLQAKTSTLIFKHSPKLCSWSMHVYAYHSAELTYKTQWEQEKDQLFTIDMWWSINHFQKTISNYRFVACSTTLSPMVVSLPSPGVVYRRM